MSVRASHDKAEFLNLFAIPLQKLICALSINNYFRAVALNDDNADLEELHGKITHVRNLEKTKL